MNKFYKEVIDSDKFDDATKYYWGYQYRLASEVLVPQLEDLGIFKKEDIVCEIGCAEGGVLLAFVDKGARGAFGTDIVKTRIKEGKKIFKLGNHPVKLVYHDIINDEIDEKWLGKTDLVLLRDVIEHVDDPLIALKQIRKMIRPGGNLFVTFPPYHSPYGGHQQTLNNFWGKLPYIHLLPKSIFFWMIKSGREADQVEVKRLNELRLTPKKFMAAAKEAGFEIYKQDYYLLRPVFKMKFGLPALKISALSWLPFVKSLFSLEASYVLRVPEK